MDQRAQIISLYSFTRCSHEPLYYMTTRACKRLWMYLVFDREYFSINSSLLIGNHHGSWHWRHLGIRLTQKRTKMEGEALLVVPRQLRTAWDDMNWCHATGARIGRLAPQEIYEPIAHMIALQRNTIGPHQLQLLLVGSTSIRTDLASEEEGGSKNNPHDTNSSFIY